METDATGVACGVGADALTRGADGGDARTQPGTQLGAEPGTQLGAEAGASADPEADAGGGVRAGSAGPVRGRAGAARRARQADRFATVGHDAPRPLGSDAPPERPGGYAVPSRTFADGLYGLAELARERGGLASAIRSDAAARLLEAACRAPGAMGDAHRASVADLLTVLRYLERALRPLSLDWYGAGRGPDPAGGQRPGRGLAGVDLCHATSGGLAALPGLLAKRFFGTPLLVTEHGSRLREHYLTPLVPDPTDPVSPPGHASHSAPVRALIASFHRQLTAEVYARADLVTAGGAHTRRWQERCGADPARVRTVYPGLDARRFAAVGDDGAGDAAGGDCAADADDGRTLLWVGRIEPTRDLIGLLHAFAEVRRAEPGARLRIVDTGPAAPGVPGALATCPPDTAHLDTAHLDAAAPLALAYGRAACDAAAHGPLGYEGLACGSVPCGPVSCGSPGYGVPAYGAVAAAPPGRGGAVPVGCAAVVARGGGCATAGRNGLGCAAAAGGGVVRERREGVSRRAWRRAARAGARHGAGGCARRAAVVPWSGVPGVGSDARGPWSGTDGHGPRAGAGPLGAAAYRTRCAALAAQLFPDEAPHAHAAGRSPVTFETLGDWDVPNLPETYAAASVVVRSSLADGDPVGLIETMLRGRATVSTDVGAVAEVVGDTGLLVPPRNPRALAAACLTLLRDGVRRERLGAAARSRALELFDAEHNAAVFRGLYLELMSHAPVRRADAEVSADGGPLPFAHPAEAHVPGHWTALDRAGRAPAREAAGRAAPGWARRPDAAPPLTACAGAPRAEAAEAPRGRSRKRKGAEA
ncbi:glycosyltransferase [Streptomyces sp. AC536]|nr:glycosyltransferase [Streptomyces buecherae]QNJ44252.1 glycosyltransferase [Streptomyces buecherae]